MGNNGSDGDSGNALVCGGKNMQPCRQVCSSRVRLPVKSSIRWPGSFETEVFGPYTWMYQLKEKHEFPPVYGRDPFVKASFASYMRRPLAPTGRIYWVCTKCVHEFRG